MGAAVKVTRMDHTPQELRALAAKSKNTAQARRLLAIAMLLERASRLDAARLTHLRQDLGDSAGFRLIWHEELAESLGILEWQDM